MSKWSWPSALAAASAASVAVILARPRDPTFHLISIAISSFHLNLPLLDVELNLTVHVANPNVVPIRYSAATMSIFYAGCLLGTAEILAGSQPATSCRILLLPARIKGVELSRNAASLIADAAHREMELDAEVDISGTAQVLFWENRFKVHLSSHVVVDPVYLNVIEQENQPELQLFT